MLFYIPNFTQPSQGIQAITSHGSLVRVRCHGWHVETRGVEIHGHPVHALLVSHLEFLPNFGPWTVEKNPWIHETKNKHKISYIKLEVSINVYTMAKMFFSTWLLCGKPNHTEILGDLHILFYISWLGHSLVLIHMCIVMDASIDSRANNSASTIEFHLLPSSFIDFHIIYHPIYPYHIIYSVYIYIYIYIYNNKHMPWYGFVWK